MNKTHTQTLLRDFPRLYRGRHKSLQESLMSFGFECGDGWFSLIYKLSADIERLAVESGLNPLSDEWPEVTQVKEKFGALSYYMRGASEEMGKLIMEFEEQTARVCEICGKDGKLRREGWLKVRCDGCQAE